MKDLWCIAAIAQSFSEIDASLILFFFRNKIIMHNLVPNTYKVFIFGLEDLDVGVAGRNCVHAVSL